MKQREEKPDYLYAVWHAAPPWTAWEGDTKMYRTQEEAEARARDIATLKCKAVVYRAYPVAEYQAEEPTRTKLYA